MRGVFAVLMFVAAAGCVAPERVDTVPQTMAFSQVDAEEAKIDELTALIAALGPDVDPAEAALVARIAVEDPLIWAKEWGVEDAPYIHNIKVNQGKKPRGLCKDWADDLQVRLAREGVQTLDWHRAIANHDNILVEHSTLIVSAKGDGMADGIVLDPWRLGQGQLFFTKVTQDPKYRWVERSEVFAYKRKRRDARNNTDS
ncbi:hypothetical protein [uncultured Pelagimonas sp.]|uniref:hypothetical protein n=1 Tax=uncultured Pelagimonas sp. TaxID=1618102 RepID=UPI002623AF52|nr:hypothetical protein [uncultured Pelagimonas sp.]